MTMIAVNDATFHEGIRQEGVTLVEFGAAWCPPCKAIKPLLDQLGAEHGDALAVLELDCDDSPRIATEYGIMSMPTVIVFHDGQPVEKLVGLRPKAVYETLVAKYMA
ncbi:thioredoxin family protein [Paenibacillus glycinis]|uniref:Thioredoxin n=1 Tax=Paenibacillus glycinis TaxID=2697035 RepID=A0ABW9XKJ8_9BACL|nr:thioredoxin family protein [Paenibacillus glycinis]NBD23143.1 thiol reductase thioredoxin [Paenibacillus glycinis]